MRILNSYNFAPALLVFLVVTQTSSWAAERGLHSDVNQNPLNVVYQPIPTSTGGPFRPQFSGTPSLSSSSASATANTFSPSSSIPTSDQLSDVIAENVLQFGLNVAQQLNELDPQASRSEIFSPLSIFSALSLLMLGAKGKSYQELKKVIGIENSAELANNPGKYHELFGAMLDDMEHFDVNAKENDASSRRKHPNWWHSLKNMLERIGGSNPRRSEQVQHTIKVANGLFVQNGYSLNPDYSQVITSIYDSQVTPLDFQKSSRQAVNYINKWVNDNTNGKIREILTEDVSASTTIILASVLYFRGFWETPFFPRSTKEGNFYPDGPNSKPIQVQLMATGGIFPYYDAKEYDCRIIGLPYKGNETTMYVIQPNDSTTYKLRGLMSVLNAGKINEMIDRMVLKTTVMVFPKMHLTRTLNMRDILHSLDVTSVFNMGLSDLSLIGGARQTVSSTPDSAHVAAAVTAPFRPVERTRLVPVRPQLLDRFNETPLFFASRFGGIETNSTVNDDSKPSKASHSLNKRQVPNSQYARNVQALSNLEGDRFKHDAYPSDLFVDEMIHKVDFEIDEQGTEAAAATAAYLHRSGTDVVFRGDTPFLLVIRHDPTKLPLFYGIINKPEL